ncbi:hypothetical protein BJF79_07275 [Actinomadura sp. CNU-125]|uniref:hypothetical protein n=1 Tax=Actinomadura sp. CNU-125 TaxID=1904961 RepID=UPI000959B53E|nr:hypothetical protein [Actinomadura sp. CNU-125]OLT34364.1 hypothetical protein BJF79_07275 [Actinomadura sp. CNU-125]
MADPRIAASGGHDADETRLRRLVERAERLAADIVGRAELEGRIDRCAFAEGYRLGFLSGRDVGYQQAEEEAARDWARIALRVRNMARVPTFAELQARRNAPPSTEPNSPKRPFKHPASEEAKR